VDAFLLVDKPAGWTSHDVVAKVRALSGIRKVGHAGTLDPMATGLLVLGLGRATRLLRFVQAAPKQYLAEAQFGVATDTLDADGAVLSREPMPVTEDDVRAVLPRFVGEISQVPPMVSARRVEGRRLYELAREGKDVAREARSVEVYEVSLLEFAMSDYPLASFRIGCGTGTYVRTLVDDLARGLGGRAHLTALRRTRNGSLSVEAACTIEDLERATAAGDWDRQVISARDGLCDLPEIVVPAAAVKGIANGLAFPVGSLAPGYAGSGPVRLVHPDGDLLAVYAVTNGRAAPEVVVA
jgi:tRNA pseudouridine55 synthase